MDTDRKKRIILISLCILGYLLTGFLFSRLFSVFNNIDFNWTWLCSHGLIYCLAILSIVCTIMGHERIGIIIWAFWIIAVLCGNAIGFVIKNYTGALSVIAYRSARIAFKLLISMCFLIILFTIKTAENEAALPKRRSTVLRTLFCICGICSVISSIHDIQYCKGAEIGYQYGYQQGIEDHSRGVHRWTPLNDPYSEKPRINGGSVAFSRYWVEGYKNGYEEYQEVKK